MDKVTLYGKDKKGDFKVWTIWTEDEKLYITFGKEGGKLQLKEEVIEGKNKGRSNETSPSEQAEFEAKSRINKQIDKGYRYNKDELGEIELMPMLAHDYLKQGHRIKYPCYGSPKLDGVRCLAIKSEDGVILKSRGGKLYHVEHIINQLNSVMIVGEVFDGELYVHGSFLEEIVSAVKKPNELTPSLHYVIFDIVDKQPFEDRLVKMELDLRRFDHCPNIQTLIYKDIANEDTMKYYHKEYVSRGYEGICLRNKCGMYESGKRSADLQKYKEFLDEEFEIIGILKDRNENAVFGLYDPTANAYFTCTYGDFDQRKYQLEHPEEFIGKMLTVKYQARYKDSKLPQFPTGVVIRSYE